MIKRGLFPKKSKVEVPSDDRLNSLSARMKVLESRHSDLRKMFEFLETNFISHKRKVAEDLKEADNEVYLLKRSVKQLQDVILVIKNELSLKGDKEDVEVIKKYTEFWNPVKFVTTDQVEEMIKEHKKE